MVGRLQLLVVAALVSLPLIGASGCSGHGGLSRQQRQNEASAIRALLEINESQRVFALSCGNGRYAPTLASLAMPPPGQDGYMSSELAVDPSVKSGYTISLKAGDTVPNEIACNGTPVVATYFALAKPLAFGSTGSRFFSTNQDRAIFASTSVIEVTFTGAPTGATRIDKE